MKKSKLQRKWWSRFVRRSHYFEGASALGKLKRLEYMDFISRTPITGDRVLKTDLFVEAKDKEDNYLPLLDCSNRFVGMDISLETVRVARTKLKLHFPEMLFVVCDATRLPFKPEVFDSIISDSTLDHIPLSKLPDALSGVSDVLKKGGKLVLSLNNVYNLPAVIKRKLRNSWDPNWFFTFSISLRRTKALLRKSNFDIQESAYILPLHPFQIAWLRFALARNFGLKSAEKWVFLFNKIVKGIGLSRLFSMQLIVTAKKEPKD
ncbi:class I SAM-dependent methyltransferase [Acidobacteriota bacterium]